MSIQKRLRKKGNVYVVHYWDTDRSKYVNKTFDKRGDAVAYEAQVTLAKRRGELADLDAGQERLSDFLPRWWAMYGNQHLTPKTQKQYAGLLRNYVEPALGTYQLRRISPLMIAEWKEVLIKRKIGTETLRKTMSMLQGIMERAVEWERIRTNPVKAVKKPVVIRHHQIRVTSSAELAALERSIPRGSGRVLVSLIGRGGLRPGEALRARQSDIGTDTLLVHGTKTGYKPRYVPLTDELRAALPSGSGGDLLVSGRAGNPWGDSSYRNFRKRVFAPAAKGLGVSTRPYDLRHSFASERFGEGTSPIVIAEMMGHTLQTLLSTYVHVMEEAA